MLRVGRESELQSSAHMVGGNLSPASDIHLSHELLLRVRPETQHLPAKAEPPQAQRLLRGSPPQHTQAVGALASGLSREWTGDIFGAWT